MSPLRLGNKAPMRTFNASATQFMPSSQRTASSSRGLFNGEASILRKEQLE